MKMFNQMIRELCKELEITFTELSDHWIFRLEKSGKTFYLIGNRFDLNLTASGALADDKVATYTVLKNSGLPAVPHSLLYNENFFCNKPISPRLSEKIDSLLKTASFPLVLKPNRGSRSRGVSLSKTPEEARKNLENLLKTDESIAVCPFLDAPFEYRCFFLDDEILLIYQKPRLKNSWRHGIGKNNPPSLVGPASPLFKKLSSLALAAGKALNVRFVTIDILEEKSGNLKVLEINQGVTTTLFSELVENGYELSKDIYRKALKKLFML